MFTLISFSVLRSAILSQALWYNKSSKLIMRVSIYLKFLKNAYIVLSICLMRVSLFMGNKQALEYRDFAHSFSRLQIFSLTYFSANLWFSDVFKGSRNTTLVFYYAFNWRHTQVSILLHVARDNLEILRLNECIIVLFSVARIKEQNLV